MTYTRVNINLTDNQRTRMMQAAAKGRGITLVINPHKTGDTLLLTDAQVMKLRSSKSNFKVSLSANQLKAMKSGGFLQFLIPLALASATALSAHGGKRLGEKVFGKGLIRPGNSRGVL